MGLYELCANAMNNTNLVCNSRNVIDCSEDIALPVMSSTKPAFLKGERSNYDSRQVFYISDLHLDNHIVNRFPNGASDSQVKEYIDSVVSSLFIGKFEAQVRNLHENPIVFFGGDTAASFVIAELFYQTFIERWNQMEDEEHNRILSVLEPIEQEIDKIDEEIESWACHHGWTRRATKPLSEYDSVPAWVKELDCRRDLLENQQNELEDQLPYDWEKIWGQERRVRFCYVILGNHEYGGFDSYEACVTEYSALFSRLGMTFLNSESAILADYTPYIRDEGEYLEEESPAEELPTFAKAVLLGGTGWTERNLEYNAEQGIYGVAIDAALEKSLSRSWMAAFIDASKKAMESHAVLVVLSHMPPSDWLPESENTSNCVFFHGHTHRNTAYSDEHNRHIIADNQVGYFSERFAFRQVSIYEPRNPYAALSDGIYETTTLACREFYRFLSDDIPGTGNIDRVLRKGGKFYVVKEQDYYGFFATSEKITYICNGGILIKLPKQKDLEYFTNHFSLMVSLYLRALSPLRDAQEKLSSLVKSFGGNGRIHGTIIDIDFFNHIMISPYNGQLTFYNSPVFGIVKCYESLQGLLQDKCPEYAERFLTGKVAKQLPKVGFSDSDYTRVDIKNSPYRISTRINALQRLFSGHVLRAWNDDALQEVLKVPELE